MSVDHAPRRARGEGALERLPALRDRYALGRSDLRVSPFCLGMVSDPRVVPAAFDAGINFFFVSSDMHWPYYEGIRRGLAMLFERGGGVRDDVVVGVVTYVAQPEFTWMPTKEVIEAVPGMERADLSIIGGAYAQDFYARVQSHARLRAKESLAVRAVGVSFHDRISSVAAVNHELVDIAFVRYNTLHRGAEADIFPRLEPRGSTLLYSFKTLSGSPSRDRYRALELEDGAWIPEPEDHYRYALTRHPLDGILLSFHDESHLRALERAIVAGPLPEDESQYIADLGDVIAGRAKLE